MLPVRIAVAGREQPLADFELPLELERLLPDSDPAVREWEVEIGFGKGRYLLEQAAQRRDAAFLGIEVASKYYRLVRDRASRRGLQNLVLLRGEALYLLSSILPLGFARAVHVYFPDPWPKSRHHGRRLFDPESLDLVLRLLKPGGSICFATDFLEYGALVTTLLEAHPALVVDREPAWAEAGARTHYEDKYMREGREIVRLEARLASVDELFHPDGARCVLAATASPPPVEPSEEDR